MILNDHKELVPNFVLFKIQCSKLLERFTLRLIYLLDLEKLPSPNDTLIPHALAIGNSEPTICAFGAKGGLAVGCVCLALTGRGWSWLVIMVVFHMRCQLLVAIATFTFTVPRRHGDTYPSRIVRPG